MRHLIWFLILLASAVARADVSYSSASGAASVQWGPLNSAKVVAGGGLLLADSSATCGATIAGSLRWHSSALEICNGSTWTSAGGGDGGVTTMAAVGSSPNANGASISGVTLTLQPADATNPGIMTTGTQSFAGAKTFTSDIAGNISTADALSTEPAGCDAGDFVTDIGADGTLTCDTPAGGASQWTSDSGGIYFVGTGDDVVSIGTASGTDSINESLRVTSKTQNQWVATFIGPVAGDPGFGMITLDPAIDFGAAWFQSFHDAAVTDNPLRINPQGGDVSIAAGGGQAIIGSAAGKVTMTGYTSCAALTTNGSDVVGCTPSDERLKKDIVPFERSIESLQFNSKSFKFKDPSDLDIQHHGFIAQEVMKSLPEAVILGSDGYYQLDYWAILAAQNNALKEAFARIEELEKKSGQPAPSKKYVATTKVREAKEWEPWKCKIKGCENVNKENAERLAKIRALKKVN